MSHEYPPLEHLPEREPAAPPGPDRRQESAFRLFLALPDTNPSPETARVDFANAYIGRYDSREALVADTIATFGWAADLDRRLARDPLLRSMTTLDHASIWAFVGEHFTIIEADGGVFVFEQAP